MSNDKNNNDSRGIVKTYGFTHQGNNATAKYLDFDNINQGNINQRTFNLRLVSTSYASYIHQLPLTNSNLTEGIHYIRVETIYKDGTATSDITKSFKIDKSVTLNKFSVDKTDVKDNDTIKFEAKFDESVQNVQLQSSINGITATQPMTYNSETNQYNYNYTVGNSINGTDFSQLNGQCTVTLLATDNLGNSNFNDTPSNQITLTLIIHHLINQLFHPKNNY